MRQRDAVLCAGHLNLAAAHGRKRGFVRLGRDAGAEARVYTYGYLGKGRLDEQDVRYHADIGAHADELDGLNRLGCVGVRQVVDKRRGAKGRLLKHAGIALALDVGEFGDELPALGALDAMGDGEVSAFLRLGVIFAVGVEREEHLATERARGFDDRGGDPLGLGGAERAGHEVVLHIDDDEIAASHGASLHGDGVCVMVAEAEGRAASYRCAVTCRSCGERSQAMGEYQHITHGFDSVFDERSRVLVLGSFPSVLSRENAFYYGNPQNRFWRVIAACVGVPVPPNEGDALPGGIPASLAASIEAKRELLLGHGIALWDVIESCDIKGSSDASIKNVVPARIERIVGSAHIGVVFCNGGTAGRLYRRYLQDRTGIPAVVLPSTSPANASWSLEGLVGRWSQAFDELAR